MRIRFWGTRGSLPAPLNSQAVRAKLVNALVKGAGRNLDTAEKAEAFLDGELSFAERGAFGGNTSCVEIETGGPDFMLCDLGSGAREFSLSSLGRGGPGPKTYHVLVSHVHWDHIMGFPFFVPAFIPGTKIKLYSCHPKLEQAIRGQNSGPCFPVEFEALAAGIEFIPLEEGKPYEICGATVTGKGQLHSNESYGYRLEKDGKTVIYTTDAEYKPDNAEAMRQTAAFFKDADLVIFDAMYSLADSISMKEDWGHSSNVMGVELSQMAGAKTLCLFHHEPVNSDEQIQQIFNETVRLEELTRTGAPLNIVAAYDGLVLDV